MKFVTYGNFIIIIIWFNNNNQIGDTYKNNQWRLRVRGVEDHSFVKTIFLLVIEDCFVGLGNLVAALIEPKKIILINLIFTKYSLQFVLSLYVHTTKIIWTNWSNLRKVVLKKKIMCKLVCSFVLLITNTLKLLKPSIYLKIILFNDKPKRFTSTIQVEI